MVTGRVAEFDEYRGLGTVVADDGRRLAFHCTAIADGTRTIPVDIPVEFDVVAGPLGRHEASGIRPRPGSADTTIVMPSPANTANEGSIAARNRALP